MNVVSLLDKLSGRFARITGFCGLKLVAILHRGSVQTGPRIRLFGAPIVRLSAGSQLIVGADVVLCSKSFYTALGVNHPVIVRTLKPGARIVIGNRSGISGAVICAAVSVRIGDDCLIGANCTIVDTDFHPTAPDGRRSAGLGSGEKEVVIGDNVFLGAGVMVLKGSQIGRNSIIGAGSVVSGVIPPGVIAAGNPCRVIKSLVATEAL